MSPLGNSPPSSTPGPEMGSIPQDAAIVPHSATPQVLTGNTTHRHTYYSLEAFLSSNMTSEIRTFNGKRSKGFDSSYRVWLFFFKETWSHSVRERVSLHFYTYYTLTAWLGGVTLWYEMHPPFPLFIFLSYLFHPSATPLWLRLKFSAKIHTCQCGVFVL